MTRLYTLTGTWVGKVTLGDIFSMEHLRKFVELWATLKNVQLEAHTEDRITWRLKAANGEYTVKSAYGVQFLGSTVSILHKTVWKAWASPKV
jgi:hypothetical protein